MPRWDDAFERDRQMLADVESRDFSAKLLTFTRLSGPGWMQSAITLGGGSLASSLYLGVVGGVTFRWVQPFAMILGIIMLSGIAAMLVHRAPFDLATALQPLAGDRVANLVFGLGVFGMALSTITMLMLISGFVICEMFDLPLDGWAFRISCLAAAT